jgi:hypothetical protein
MRHVRQLDGKRAAIIQGIVDRRRSERHLTEGVSRQIYAKKGVARTLF